MKAKAKLINTLLPKAIKKIEKKQGIVVDKDLVGERPEYFEIPAQYRFFIATALKSTIKKVYAEVAQDGIKCVSGSVEQCFFRKEETGDYYIEVLYKGRFIK